jgi:mono/diheme cytochrome c family protein
LLLATASEAARTAPPRVQLNGKALYRTYCGKCHTLSAALAAGFGSSGRGLGVNGGPSFDELRVPVPYTVQAITEPTGGHERLSKRLSPAQVSAVAKWLARTTNRHPLPALPTDG